MRKFIFDYNKMLEYLSFMEMSINAFNSDTLRKQYRNLAKKYHPDLAYDCSEQRKRTVQFQRLNDCYEYLQICLENQYLWENIIVDINDSNFNKNQSNLKRYYQNISNRLDKLNSSLNILLKSYCNDVTKHIITILLENLETLQMKTSNSDLILDYGTLANYCDLIELFVNKVLGISIAENFDKNKNNYIGLSNDKYNKEKSEVCFLEKILLYEIMVKIIDFISNDGKYMTVKQYRKSVKKYLDIVDDITDIICSFKWMLTLPDLDTGKVNDCLDKIRKMRK